MILGTGDTTHHEFWMVYGEGQRAPAYKHDSAASARIEAERLAGLHPGISFYVLKAKRGFRTEKPSASHWSLKKRPLAEQNDDGIPF